MKKFVDEIRKAGLNDYEARSYLNLLKMGPVKVSELAGAAAIPRARIYDVLANLQAKGFVVKKTSRPLVYAPMQPAEAFSNFSEHKKKSFSSQLNELDSIRKFVEKQFDYSKNDSISKTDSFVVHNRNNIYSKLLLEAQKEKKVTFLSTGEGIERKKSDLGAKLKEKQVKASFIADSSLPRSILIGKSGLFLFLTDSNTEDSQERGVFIRSEPLAKSFAGLIKKK